MKLIPSKKTERGILQMDLIAGLALLTIAIVPLGYSFAQERQMLKTEYHRSVIVELVDGEMEILAAGAARNLPDGTQPLFVQARAVGPLPPSHFQLTKTGNHLRLEWQADEICGISPVVRETTLK